MKNTIIAIIATFILVFGGMMLNGCAELNSQTSAIDNTTAGQRADLEPNIEPYAVPEALPMISAGGAHSLAVDSLGRLWAWGNNQVGQLGVGSLILERLTPICLTTLIGNPLYGKRIAKADAGAAHSMAIDSTGALWTWGWNMCGQLGNNSTVNSFVPVNIASGKQFVQVSAGADHSTAIDSTGALWTWGRGIRGLLGNGGTEDSLIPIKINSIPGKVAQISAGLMHNMAIDGTGALWVWGSGNYGMLGTGSWGDVLVPVSLTAMPGNPLYGKKIKQVALGSYHSIILDTSGGLWGCGENPYKQLGYHSGGDVLVPVQINAIAGNPLYGKQIAKITAGSEYTMAIDSTGALWTFGHNGNGNLGNGGTALGISEITAIPGNPLYGRQITQISAGKYHSMAIDSRGSVWVWGRNSEGQLGLGDTTDRHEPVRLNLNLNVLSADPAARRAA